ncbi:MAG TPA: acyl-CoA synthetase [Alphaproteobacteria bacterium]|jgi:fatty-acyl-CoA synthase|nr:acyl-CoA synthetase [Alphaproteobacteria bacterium]
MPSNIYDLDLDKNQANHQPLTPLSFLRRTAEVFPQHPAVVHGDKSFTYHEFYARCRALASALHKRGLGRGDTVAILAPNVPAMLEAHYGVPMAGAVLNTINYRLDAPAIAFILDHGEAKALIVDKEFSGLAKAALAQCKVKPLVIDIDDPEYTGPGEAIGEVEYEAFIAKGDRNFSWAPPGDEWDAISLNYTSGTTGNPKGVVFHHRGAYLLSMGNVVTASMQKHPVYLWTLPMFHCNGWCFTWSLSVAAGTHICLRRTEAALIYAAIAKHNVTHMCGAPVVMGMLINAKAEERKSFSHRIEFFTAAAPPPASVIGAMTASGFSVTHLYGLTETYGPSVICDWQKEWDALDAEAQAATKSRQGVRYQVLEDLAVMDPETMQPVPNDGESMGEVMFRGNVIMKGYLKNPKATKESFEGGWYHSGDLGVRHPDGYIQLRDRSKDIIISGGENISSIEVEDTLYKHPGILEAAVVARADEKWGETPCAFITRKNGHENLTEADVIAYCRDNLAHYKCPRHVVFTELPKTSTGKVQKFKLREMTKQVG